MPIRQETCSNEFENEEWFWAYFNYGITSKRKRRVITGSKNRKRKITQEASQRRGIQKKQMDYHHKKKSVYKKELRSESLKK